MKKYGFADFAQKHSSSYRSKPVQPKAGWVVGAKFMRPESHSLGGEILTISSIQPNPSNSGYDMIYALEDDLWTHRYNCTLVEDGF